MLQRVMYSPFGSEVSLYTPLFQPYAGADGRIGLQTKSIINRMGFKLRDYRIWIRDVFWLGPPAPTPGTQGAGIR